jgi:hypothetical protein
MAQGVVRVGTRPRWGFAEVTYSVENSIPSATNYSFRGGGQGGPETGPIATLSSDRFVVGWIRNSNCLYRKPLLKTS